MMRMEVQSPRLERERRTMEAMITCYCHGTHGTSGELCADCRGLLDYATIRLERCPFGETKPTCVKCPIHCYQPELRERVKNVMRYAGPRMIWRHPILAVRHWLDAYRKVPAGAGRTGLREVGNAATDLTNRRREER